MCNAPHMFLIGTFAVRLAYTSGVNTQEVIRVEIHVYKSAHVYAHLRQENAHTKASIIPEVILTLVIL